MSFIYRATLATLLAIGCALPASAQSLTTLYAGGNGQAGNMFDLTAQVDLEIDAFDVHLENVGPVPVEVYWREGTVAGADLDAAGWNLLGRATVASNGYGVPTRLPVGGLLLRAGRTYGIYIVATDDSSLAYTNGENVYSNADLSLRTWYGKALPHFTGDTFSPRQWNGTVYYTTGDGFTTCAAEGLRGAKLTLCQKICEVDQSPATLNGLIRMYRAAYREDPPCASLK